MTSAIVKLNDIPVAQPTRRPAVIPKLAENPPCDGIETPTAAPRGLLIGILLGAAMWAIILALAIPRFIG